jgi:protein-disulfide isomerase
MAVTPDRATAVTPPDWATAVTPGNVTPDEAAPVEDLAQGASQPAAPGRRKRRLAVGAIAAALIVVVAAGILVQHSGPYRGPYAPITRTADNTVTMTQPGVTKPVLVIYEDYQCSICNQFERANGNVIERLAYQGHVKVIYHVFSIFVGMQPRQANSTRAWAAAKCVPAGSWVKYHDLLYAHQPGEAAQDGFPVTQLLALGRQIGLTGTAFTQCVTSQRYAAQIVPLSYRLIGSGITSTPAVTLNGQHIRLSVLLSPKDTLSAAILAAH